MANRSCGKTLDRFRAPSILWHYTTIETRLPAILRTGFLMPATDGVPQGERPVVWFSRQPEWEPTACKRWDWRKKRGRSLDEIAHGHGGLARFGVDPSVAPHDWEAFRQLSGISAAAANGLRESIRSGLYAGTGAKSSDWYVSFEPVPVELCTIEVYLESLGWVPRPDPARGGTFGRAQREPRPE